MKYLIALFTLSSFVFTSAQAQTAPPKWNEVDIAWTVAPTCVDGSPTAVNCAATGYRVERATAATGPWTVVTTTTGTVLTYRATGLPEGTNYFRVTVLAGTRTSVPSNAVSRVATPPNPNPVTLRVVETTAMSIVVDPDRLAFVLGSKVGTVELGAECDPARPIGDGFYVVATPVQRARPKLTELVAAKCG